MAAKGPPLQWKSFEVCELDENGEIKDCPVSDVLAEHGKQEAGKALKKMKLLEDHGWPDAILAMRDDRGRPLIVKKEGDTWLLKCKPSCWRLYFYVEEGIEGIIYTHAVCKKQNREDSGDAAKAQRIADSIKSGKSHITEIEFPPR